MSLMSSQATLTRQTTGKTCLKQLSPNTNISVMYWQEDKAETPGPVISKTMIDVGFRINCPCLPCDHSWALKESIGHTLPWLEEGSGIAIHDIHGAESGNGWIRPDNHDALLHLSQRTSLYIRTPLERVDDVVQLAGSTHHIAGYKLLLGQAKTRQLFAHATLLVRHCPPFNKMEKTFIGEVMTWLKEHNIKAPRLMPGKQHTIQTPEGKLISHSLMLDGLQNKDSLWLQEHGIGHHLLLGCGIFIPCKGIDAVYKQQQQ